MRAALVVLGSVLIAAPVAAQIEPARPDDAWWPLGGGRPRSPARSGAPFWTANFKRTPTPDLSPRRPLSVSFTPRASWATLWMIRFATQRTAPVCLAALADSDQPEAKKFVDGQLGQLFHKTENYVEGNHVEVDSFVLDAAEFSPRLRVRLGSLLPHAYRLRPENYGSLWAAVCSNADPAVLDKARLHPAGVSRGSLAAGGRPIRRADEDRFDPGRGRNSGGGWRRGTQQQRRSGDRDHGSGCRGGTGPRNVHRLVGPAKQRRRGNRACGRCTGRSFLRHNRRRRIRDSGWFDRL